MTSFESLDTRVPRGDKGLEEKEGRLLVDPEKC